MRIFLDHNVPHMVRRYLKDKHEVVTSAYLGWDKLENGELLEAAESAGFDAMITADKDYLAYRSCLDKCNIALIVLWNGNRPVIANHLTEIAAKINMALPGTFYIHRHAASIRPGELTAERIGYARFCAHG